MNYGNVMYNKSILDKNIIDYIRLFIFYILFKL